MRTAKHQKRFFVCVGNEDHPASLERRKICVAIGDPASELHRLLRIIDESGEDYLYPTRFFREVALSQSVRKAVLAAG